MLKTWTEAQWKGLALIVGSFVILLIVIGGWWVLSEPGRQKAKAAEARGTAIVAKGDSAASAAAAGAVADFGDRQTDRNQLDQENSRDIQNQPGAHDAIATGVHDAGIRSLCKRAAYRDDPQCVRLRKPGPAAAP
jgi:hypothetical protein